MRIQNTSSLKDIEKNTWGTSSIKKGLSSFFAAELTQREEEIESNEQIVETLRKEIENAGDKLMQEPTLTNFEKFRDLLSKLAKRITAEAYRLEKFGGTAQNPRYFEIITIINSDADKLYKLIVQENRDSMAITAKVIGIKGLVVDLVT
ncbi:MAG: YaaR family protein [Deltaproteobacteria bacterium]|nr:YaaR family protein [Deltaproteobacteria bacterium]